MIFLAVVVVVMGRVNDPFLSRQDFQSVALLLESVCTEKRVDGIDSECECGKGATDSQRQKNDEPQGRTKEGRGERGNEQIPAGLWGVF